MAVSISKSSGLPDDAVVLSEVEAVVHAWGVVNEWDKFSEAWALRYSSNILGVLSATCGIVINKHYRHKLKLGRYGHLSSFLPMIVVPGIATMIFHRHMISTKMLLQNTESCAICHEVRSAVIQLGFGLVYPMLLGPLSSLMLANRYSTYRLPSITKQPKELLQVARKLTKPLTGTLGYLLAFQLIFSSVFTYFELQNVVDIRKRVREVEKKLQAEGDLEFE